LYWLQAVLIIPAVPGVDATITSDEILFLPVFFLPVFRRVSSSSAQGPWVSRWPARSAISALTSRSIVQDSEILPAFDADIAGYVRKILESRRVTFHLGAMVTGFSRSGARPSSASNRTSSTDRAAGLSQRPAAY